jgi:hypothetical protein
VLIPTRRVVAFLLGGLVTAFWLWFGVASGVGEKLGAGNFAAHLLVPGGIFLATLIVAWRRERFGGLLFLIEGLVVAIGYPLMARGRFSATTVVMVVLTMSLPPFVAGVLLLAERRPRRAPPPEGVASR